MAAPVPTRDLDLEAVLGEAERELADALAELGTLRTASQAHGEELAALRRAAAARAGRDRDRPASPGRDRTARDRGSGQAAAAAERRATLEAGLAAARSGLTEAIEAERAAAARREKARERADQADAERAAAHQRAVTASASAATLRARLDGLEARLAEEETRGIARAARRAGGRRLDEDLSIDPALRAAAEAALAEATRAYVVTRRRRRVARLGTRLARGLGTDRRADRARRRPRASVPRGAGRRRRRDPRRRGPARRHRRRATPARPRRVAARPGVLSRHPAGTARRAGSSVTRDGERDRRPARGHLRGRRVRPRTPGGGDPAGRRARDATRRTRPRRGASRSGWQPRPRRPPMPSRPRAPTRAGPQARAGPPRRPNAWSRRQHETAIREHAWHEAQTERLAGGPRPGHAIAAAAPQEPTADEDAEAPARTVDGAALAAWETRAAELRARRDRLAEEFAGRGQRPSRCREPPGAGRGVHRHRRGTDGPRRPGGPRARRA